MDLLGTLDVAEVLGISRQRVVQLAKRSDFPAPVAIVNKRIRVWDRAQVEQWARDTDRIVSAPDRQ